MKKIFEINIHPLYDSSAENLRLCIGTIPNSGGDELNSLVDAKEIYPAASEWYPASEKPDTQEKVLLNILNYGIWLGYFEDYDPECILAWAYLNPPEEK